MEHDAPIPVEVLLADAAWTRGLAGSLVRDAATADDVLQETWRAALGHPPRAGRPARAWLTAVVRNFSRRVHRDETRRRARERAAARPEAEELPGPEELASRLDTQRLLASLVAGLAEPYRSTVILRYWEGLSAAEISRRQGTPAGTVRWRLKTALDELRSRLDDRHEGDRGAWLALLLPIAGPPPGPAAAPAGTAPAAVALGGILAVKKLAAVIVAAVVLLPLGLHILGAFDVAPPPGRPEGAPAPTPAGEPVASAPADGPGEAQPATGVEVPADAGMLLARLVDPEGAPVVGAEVGLLLSPSFPPVRSGEDGVVLLEIPLDAAGAGVRLAISAAGRVPKRIRATVRRGEVARLGDVTLEPGGVLAGRVLLPDGSPAARARVRLGRPTGPLDEVPEPHVFQMGGDLDTRTDADGRFRFEGAPLGHWHAWAWVEGMRWCAGRAVEVRADGTDATTTVTLEPLAPEEHIAGVVLAPDGEPVPNPLVRYEILRASGGTVAGGSFVAGPDGRFDLPNEGGGVAHFTARDVEGRYAEARVRDYVPGSGEVVLRLGAARRISVLSVDPAGEPVANVLVRFVEPGTETDLRRVPAPEGRVEAVPPEGRFEIVLEAPGRMRARLGPWGTGEAPPEVRAVLRAPAGIRGTVRSGDRPVAAARVRAHARTDRAISMNGFPVRVEPRWAAEAVTSEDGSFLLPVTEAGSFVVRADAEGLAAAETEPLAYDPAEGVSGLALEPGPGGAIEGEVIVAGGGDPGGTIVGISRGDAYGRTMRVGPDGRFRFEHLTPGPWQVEVRKAEILPGAMAISYGGEAGPIPANCRVEEGRTTVFDLRVAGRASLRGRILIDDAAPAAFRAGLYPEGGGLFTKNEVEVGPDGRFRLEGEEGPARLLVRPPEGKLSGTLIVADLTLRGETRWECVFETGTLGTEAVEPGSILFHRAVRPDGTLVLTRLPDEGGEVRVPRGEGEVVSFRSRLWASPADWPVLRKVRVE